MVTELESHNRTVLYPNPWYNVGFYKGTALSKDTFLLPKSILFIKPI